MFAYFLHIVIRGLARNWLRTLGGVLVLAVSLAGIIDGIFWWHYTCSYDTHYRSARRIYVAQNTSEEQMWSHVDSLPRFPDMVESVACFSRCTMFSRGQYATIGVVDSACLQILGVKVISGDERFLERDGGYIAVTAGFARRYFGTEDVLGRSLEYALSPQFTDRGNAAQTIVAVLQTPSLHSELSYDILSGAQPALFRSELLLLKLCKGVSAARVQSAYAASGYTTIRPLVLRPVRQLHLEKPQISDALRTLRHMLLLSLIMLFCAMLNLGSLEAGTMMRRQQTLYLRFLSGSRLKHLHYVSLLRMIVVVTGAWLCSLAVVEYTWPWMMRQMLVEPEMAVSWWRVFPYACFVLLVFFVLCRVGSRLVYRMPTWTIGHITQGEDLVQYGSLVLQLAAVAMMAVLAAGMFRQIRSGYVEEKGFDMQHLAFFLVRDESKMSQIADSLRHTAGVLDVFVGEMLFPVTGMAGEPMSVDTWSGHRDEAPVQVVYVRNAAGMVAFYHIGMLAGDALSWQHEANDIMLAESTAAAFGWTPAEAVGQSVEVESGAVFRVVGVCGDINNLGPKDAVPLYVFGNRTLLFFNHYISYRYAPGCGRSCRKKVLASFPGEIFQGTLLDAADAQRKMLLPEQRTLMAVAGCWMLSLVICMIGFCAFVSQLYRRYSMEIALRKVHGATLPELLPLFMRPLSRIILPGIAVALPAAVLLFRLWVKEYVRPVSFGWLHCLLVFAVVLSMISLPVGKYVHKMLHSSPGEQLKTL